MTASRFASHVPAGRIAEYVQFVTPEQLALDRFVGDPSEVEFIADDDADHDPAHALAQLYADTLNLLERTGDDVEDLADDAEAELDGTGWNLARDEDTDLWIPVRDEDEVDADEPEQMAMGGTRAPKGGIDIAGWFYRGGQFIPGSALAQASPAQREKLEQAKASAAQASQAKADARKARGSVDTGKLQGRLAKHADQHGLTDFDRRRAGAAARLLHRHHGELALHRVEELADRLEAALSRVGDDEWNAEGLRANLGQQLARLHAVREGLQSAGVTGEVKQEVAASSDQEDAYKIDTEKSDWAGKTYHVGHRVFTKPDAARKYVDDLKEKGLAPIKLNDVALTIDHGGGLAMDYRVQKRPEVRGPGGYILPEKYRIYLKRSGTDDEWEGEQGVYDTPEEAMSAWLKRYAPRGKEQILSAQPGVRAMLDHQRAAKDAEQKQQADAAAAAEKVRQDWSRYQTSMQAKASELKGRKQDIQIGDSAGKQHSVPATVYGPLAIHKTLDGSPGYTLTHVGSGLSIKSNLTNAQAKELVASIQDSGADLSPASANQFSSESRDKVVQVLKAWSDRKSPSWHAGKTPSTRTEDEPGFTGTDSMGREWVNGELVAKGDEEKGQSAGVTGEVKGEEAAAPPAIPAEQVKQNFREKRIATGSPSPDQPPFEATLRAGKYNGKPVYRWQISPVSNVGSIVAAGDWTEDKAAAESGWHAAGRQYGMIPPEPSDAKPAAGNQDTQPWKPTVERPHKFSLSEYRGANKPWVAQITGTDPRYGVAQSFVDKARTDRGANMRRNRDDHEWEITEPGVYRVGGSPHGGKEDRIVALIPDGRGGMKEVELTKEHAAAYAKGLEKKKPAWEALADAVPGNESISRWRQYASGDSPPTRPEDAPGFTGTDSLGREWQDGKLVAKDTPDTAPNAGEKTLDSGSGESRISPSGSPATSAGTTAGSGGMKTRKATAGDIAEMIGEAIDATPKVWSSPDGSKVRVYLNHPKRPRETLGTIEISADGEVVLDRGAEHALRYQTDLASRIKGMRAEASQSPATRPSPTMPSQGEIVPADWEGKQTWQMPRRIYMARRETNPAQYGSFDMADIQHKREVEKALMRGESVPPEVLADYPDLVEKYASSTTAPNAGQGERSNSLDRTGGGSDTTSSGVKPSGGSAMNTMNTITWNAVGVPGVPAGTQLSGGVARKHPDFGDVVVFPRKGNEAAFQRAGIRKANEMTIKVEGKADLADLHQKTMAAQSAPTVPPALRPEERERARQQERAALVQSVPAHEAALTTDSTGTFVHADGTRARFASGAGRIADHVRVVGMAGGEKIYAIDRKYLNDTPVAPASPSPRAAEKEQARQQKRAQTLADAQRTGKPQRLDVRLVQGPSGEYGTYRTVWIHPDGRETTSEHGE